MMSLLVCKCPRKRLWAPQSWRVTLPLYVNVGSVEPPAVEFTAPVSPPLGPADCFERVLWADRGWDKLSDRQKDILAYTM